MLARAGRAVASRLSPPRADALRRLGRDYRDLALGRVREEPLPTNPGSQNSDISAPIPRLGYRYPDIDRTWLEPPAVRRPGSRVRAIYATTPAADRFDVDLLVKLNDEYSNHPIATAAPSYDSASLADNAHRRLTWVHRMVDLRGMRTLEIGCGNGFEVWSLAHNYQSEAWGVDVVEYGPWPTLADDRTHFTLADLAQQNPFEEDFFDRVISFTVWEHVLHPYSMLAETYKLLKPGGLAWIRANLFAGPKASHRYRDIFFPWPHLLFPDEVVRDWDISCGRRPIGLSRVNRLSWLHYRFYIESIGFRIRHLSFTESPFDEEFYYRFERILGCYPRWDLTKDYFLVVLEKPRS